MIKATRKINLEDLPRHESGSNKGKIDWLKSIGNSVNFIYNDIEGKVKIIKYDVKRKVLTIEYNNMTQETKMSSFMKCQCGILSSNVNKYKYSSNELINTKFGTIKILEVAKVKVGSKFVKGYTYQCLEDGYIGEIAESSIERGTGCQVCSNRIIIKGTNDIATTRPDLVKYFEDIEETYIHSIGSGKKIQLRCPECGQLKNKLISICDLDKYGFSCEYCGDGIPYPEKFIINMLSQLSIKFIKQYNPKWAKNIETKIVNLTGDKIYDFYIPSLNTIIETHGSQHYTKSFTCKGSRSLVEEQENDIIKMDLANKNNIKNYIVINSSESNMDWMKNNIIQSGLNNIIDLSNVDWDKCAEFANSSLIKKVCNLYNDGIRNHSEITEILGIGYGTINRYLNEANKLGLCDYDWKQVQSEKRMKKVLCITNGKIYNSLKEAGADLEISPKQISNCCNNYRKSVDGYKFQIV